MSKDQEPKPADQAAQEGNDLGGSPTFPNPPSGRPTGDTAGFNGSYTETEHHAQHEYDAGDHSEADRKKED